MVDLEALTGHTPGSWDFSRELNVLEVSPADDDAPSVAFVVAAPDLEHAAYSAEHFADNVTHTHLPDWDAAFANARLIAAAPDLLAEVRALRAELRELRAAVLRLEWDEAASAAKELVK